MVRLIANANGTPKSSLGTKWPTDWSKVNVENYDNIKLGRVKLLRKRVRFSCLLQQNVMWVRRFMKKIKRLKCLLQRRASVRVYKMADGTDGKSQMYVLFCYFA